MTSNENVPFSNPRAVVILIVLAFHSALQGRGRARPRGTKSRDGAVVDQMRWGPL